MEHEVTIKVSKGIAHEYLIRDVYPEVEKAGVYRVSLETAQDMLDDAEHYAHPDGPDDVPAWLPGMYRKHAAKIKAAIAQSTHTAH